MPALADLAGWPAVPAWADGVIDGTFSLGGWTRCWCSPGGQWVTFSISQRQVLIPAPLPLTEFGPFESPASRAEMLGQVSLAVSPTETGRRRTGSR